MPTGSVRSAANLLSWMEKAAISMVALSLKRMVAKSASSLTNSLETFARSKIVKQLTRDNAKSVKRDTVLILLANVSRRIVFVFR